LKTMQTAVSADAWSVSIHIVIHTTGVSRSKEQQKQFSVTLPAGGDTTVTQFLDAVNSGSGRFLTILDLHPFDESELGMDTGCYGRYRREGVWEPTHKSPQPTNCKWNPSREDPSQTIRDAGLCNGARLAITQLEMEVG